MDLTDEIERLRVRCLGCAKCSKVCPSLKHGGLDPMEIMMGGDDDVSTCIGCGNCTRVCHRTDPATVMKDLQAMAGDIHVSKVFEDTGYALPPSECELVPPWEGDDVAVMPGCVTKAKVPYVQYAAAVALRSMGVGASELEGNTCCMHPVQFREMSEPERRSYRTAMGTNARGRPIVTLCAGCSDELIGAFVDASHIIPFLADHLDSLPRLKTPMRVGMEPGCSAMPFKKEMKAVLEALGCEVVNGSMGCCGKNTSVSPSLMAERQAECRGADWIIVGCPMCQVKFDTHEGGIPVMHIAELVAMAAGDTESLKLHSIKGPGI